MGSSRSGYDLAVIGSGSAAFAASIAATGRGRSVVMIERGTVGGTCVNVGCVPSKALLAAAEARHAGLEAGRFPGLSGGAVPVDLPTLIGGKDALSGGLRAGKYVDLAADHGWEIIGGTAAFAGEPGDPVLEVTRGEGDVLRVEAGQYLIATGAAPWAPPVGGLTEAGFLTSTTAMELAELPASMVVVGGNAVGLEQAQLFARLGTAVTVVEAQDRLVPFEEPELSAAIERAFTGEGIAVHTATALTAVSRDGGGYVLSATRDGAAVELRAEQLLIATGRRPVTAELGLDRIGAATGKRGEVVVDEYLRSTHPRVWAAGDVTGHPQFVYVAAAHGSLAAGNALEGAGRRLDYTALPRVTFTGPAIAAVGMTEAEALAAGIACDCRTLPLDLLARALVNRDTRGVIKLVAEAATGRLLGVHLVADGAGEVIAAATYAIAAGMTVDQLAGTWTPYLTMTEGLRLAAQAYTGDVAKLSCCAG